MLCVSGDPMGEMMVGEVGREVRKKGAEGTKEGFGPNLGLQVAVIK